MKVVYVDLPVEEIRAIGKAGKDLGPLAVFATELLALIGKADGAFSRAEDLEGDNDDDGTEASGGEGTAPDGGAI